MERLFFISTILVALLLGCDKGLIQNNGEQERIVLTPEEIASVAYDNPRELRGEEILEILGDLKIFEEGSVVTKNASLRLKILGKSYADNDGNLLEESMAVATKQNNRNLLPVYEVEVTTGHEGVGKAMVSADERLPVILAYIPKGGDDVPVEENPLFQLALNTARARIEHIVQLRDSLRVKTLDKLAKHFGKLPNENVLSAVGEKIISSQRDDLVSVKSVPLDAFGIPTAVISRVGPYTSTRWDQRAPYNSRMPDGGCLGDPRVQAGCLVVAGAQILAFYEPTMAVQRVDNTWQTMNWGLLKTWQTIDSSEPSRSEMVSNLIHDIFVNTQTTPQCGGSGTQMNKMIGYLQGFLHTGPGVGERTLDVARVKSSLDNFKLSIGAGSRVDGNPGEKIRHAWVFDGYTIARKGTVNPNNGSNSLVNRYDFYLHANLGWGPSSWNGTGWYLVGNDWTVTFEADFNRHYNLDLTCVTHLGPKKN